MRIDYPLLLKLNEIIVKKKLSNTLSFILNVLSKQKLDRVLTHSVWVEYEIYGTQQIWEL